MNTSILWHVTSCHHVTFHPLLHFSIFPSLCVRWSSARHRHGHCTHRFLSEAVNRMVTLFVGSGFLRSLVNDMIMTWLIMIDRGWWLIVHCTYSSCSSCWCWWHRKTANGQDGHDFEILGPQTKFSPFSLYAMAEAWRDNLRDTKSFRAQVVCLTFRIFSSICLLHAYRDNNNMLSRR